jgi:ABC-type nitrate/sulfonate/bicarbonate transport system substrate-binding protein
MSKKGIGSATSKEPAFCAAKQTEDGVGYQRMASAIVTVIAFPGAFNLPLWIAVDFQFFQSRGIDIHLHYTASSVQQLSGLINGQWEIPLTGFDNIVAYQEGQGEAVVNAEADLFAFMGGDSAFLRLVVQPDIRSYADLKGQTLSVDALTTGFAFVLRKMLAINGLNEGEMVFERAGGVMQRFDALKTGKHKGTLLLTPFELMAKEFGCHVLQNASEILPHYQGISGAARRSWARRNSNVLVAFIRAYLDALEWLYDLRNKQKACELLVSKASNMDMKLASTAYDILVNSEGGFERKACLDIQGIETVLTLRNEYARPQKYLTNSRKYDDLTYYTAALANSIEP